MNAAGDMTARSACRVLAVATFHLLPWRDLTRCPIVDSSSQWLDVRRHPSAQLLLQFDEPGIVAICFHRVTAAGSESTHRFVVVERIGAHAPDNRSRRLTLQLCEQSTAYSAALPVIGDGDGELAQVAGSCSSMTYRASPTIVSLSPSKTSASSARWRP